MSGLPVIATREGGMAEMIDDGRTGWLAAATTPLALEETLRRALQTPANLLAAMGHAASCAIREQCDNESVLKQQMEFRHRVVRQGAVTSVNLPFNLPWSRSTIAAPTERPLAGGDAPERAAIVIRCHDSGQTLDATLESISNQTRPPAVVVVVDDGSRDLATDRALARAEKRGLIVVRKPYRGAAEAKNTGISDVFRGDRAVSAISFLEAGDRLRPKYVATCLCVLRNRSEVGVVSVWAIGAGVCQPLFARPSPAFPYSGLRMMP